MAVTQLQFINKYFNEPNELRLIKFRGWVPGQLYTYTYDPKWKKTLDFYDTQPIIIFLDNAPKGHYGLNIHFLPQKMRNIIFKEINPSIKKNPFQSGLEKWKRLSIIKGYEKALIRRYLTNHIKGKILPIPEQYWTKFRDFPTEKFYGKTSNEIFQITLQLGNK